MEFDAKVWAQRLLGPNGPAAFEASVRDRKMIRFEQVFSEDETAFLFGPDRLEAAIGEARVQDAQVDIFVGTHLVRLADMLLKSGRTAIELIGEQVAQGASLRVRDIERCDDRLAALTAAIGAQLLADTQINLYLTPAGKAGFPPHFDITDVFVLQIAGTKHWRLFEDYTNRTDLPLPDIAWDPDRYRPIGDGSPVAMKSGDVLYIPRGGMHAASCMEEPSIHLTIAATGLTGADLLLRTIDKAILDISALRQRAIDPTANPADEIARLNDLVRAALADIAEKIDCSDIVTGEVDRHRKSRPAPTKSGGLSSMFSTPPHG